MNRNNLGYRPTWAEVSASALEHNVRFFCSLLGQTKLMAVVKADGYGHGVLEVAEHALQAGAYALGVATLDEALVLRKAGITAPVVVLGYIPVYGLADAVSKQITVTIFDQETLSELEATCRRLSTIAMIHLKVDTGMNRLGLKDRTEIVRLARQAHNSTYIQLEGLFTHFAVADIEDATYTQNQFTDFQQVIQALEEEQISIPIKHCCNTAATLLYPEMHLDMVRVGVGIYGLPPSAFLEPCTTSLQSVMSLKTKIVWLKTVEQGEAISYGCTYTASEEKRIATLPIGYADGFHRGLSNKGHVLVKGIACPIVGTICMDQLMVDISNVPDVQIGEEVVLFGRQEAYQAYLPVEQLAEHLQTINYEIITQVGKRVPRVYV